MTNLFEMMQQAQGGQAMQNMARQYGLSVQQTQAAVEALLPAFSMGLQRQTQDPYAFGGLAQMMTASPFGKMFEAGGGAIPNQAQSMGNEVLGQLFGSKEVSNAVAAQAAATTGVGQAILKQMLPVIAAMLMGGLFKSTSNTGLGGILGQFTDMMRGQMGGASGGGQPAPAPANPSNPLDSILGGLFGNGMVPPVGGTQGGGPFGGGQMPGGQIGSEQMGGGILGQILTGMLGGAQAPAAPQQPDPRSREPEPQDGPDVAPPTSSATGPGSIGLDALNQMFEHGRQVQDSHQDALKSIFDTMFGGRR